MPDEPGVMQGMIPEVGIWMPGALRVDPFPAPHIVHFEWYVPIDARTHRYMIAWGSKVETEQGKKAFFDEMTYLWRDFVTGKFNNEDMFAREAMDEFYAVEDGWHRENLFGPDILVTAWRTLCANTNRGIQRLKYGPAVRLRARGRAEGPRAGLRPARRQASRLAPSTTAIASISIISSGNASELTSTIVSAGHGWVNQRSRSSITLGKLAMSVR